MRKIFSTVLVLSISALSFCGCGNSASVETSQPNIVVNTTVENEEATVKAPKVKAPTPTPTKIPTKTPTTKTSNSTIKDLIIDGNGNLVATKSNNTFAIIGSVQGVKGDKGDKGDNGSNGQDGRGIASADLDEQGNLIITYTDGETHNAGNLLAIYEANKPLNAFEQVGYELQCDYDLPYVHTFSDDLVEYSATVNNVSIILDSIDNNNPTNKYKYVGTITYSSNITRNSLSDPLVYIKVDDSINAYSALVHWVENNRTDTFVFYSSVPCVRISKLLW